MIVHNEMPSARQRIWSTIRARRVGIEQQALAAAAGTTRSLVQDYVKGLLKAGYLRVSEEYRVRGPAVRRIHDLVRDCGWEAPRVGRDGHAVLQGAVNEAMWSTMRRLFLIGDFDYRELAAHASTRSRAISQNTAQTYVLRLAHAGYLVQVQAASGPRARLARYRLRKTMDTGPRAPRILRSKAVFDVNLGGGVMSARRENTEITSM